FRPLEQALLGRRRARAYTIEHLLEDLVQLLHRAFPLELHEAQGRTLVEQHDEDDTFRHVGEEHRLLLSLVHQGGELVLTDHLGELVVGAEVGGRKGGEGGGVELGGSPTVATSCPVRSTSSAQRAFESRRY